MGYESKSKAKWAIWLLSFIELSAQQSYYNQMPKEPACGERRQLTLKLTLAKLLSLTSHTLRLSCHFSFSPLASQCLRINPLLIYERNNKKHTIGLRLIKLCIKAHFGTIKTSYLLIPFFCRLSFFWANIKSTQAKRSKSFWLFRSSKGLKIFSSHSLSAGSFRSAFSAFSTRDSWT